MVVYQKARIFNPESPKDGFYVQFNPNTLEYAAGTDWRALKKLWEDSASFPPNAKELQQQSPLLGNERGSALSVRLFFHSYINDLSFSDVRPNINRIRAFLPVQQKGALPGPSTQSNSPRITFAWGTMIYTGTLESFHATYQMFAFDGTPVQAEVAITIRGEDQEVQSTSVNQILSAAPDTDFSQQDDALFLSSVSWLFQ